MRVLNAIRVAPRDLERRNEQEQKTFEPIMTVMNAATGHSIKR